MSGSLTAAPVTILGAPAWVLSGETFTIELGLPSTTSLAAYQIELSLHSSSGTAGVDYSFGEASPVIPAEGYVFPAAGLFFASRITESATSQRLIVTDLFLAGKSTVLGLNDRIARIPIETSVSFTGSLQLSVDADALILDGPELVPTPVPEYAAIAADTATMAPTTINVTAIPEPRPMLMLTITALALGFRALQTSRKRAEPILSFRADHSLAAASKRTT